MALIRKVVFTFLIIVLSRAPFLKGHKGKWLNKHTQTGKNI